MNNEPKGVERLRSPRHIVRAFIAAAVATALSGGLIGWATAGEPSVQGPVPETLELGVPHQGDAGTYTVTIYEKTPGGLVEFVAERPVVEFEWVGSRRVRDASGTEQIVHDLRIAELAGSADSRSIVRESIFSVVPSSQTHVATTSEFGWTVRGNRTNWMGLPTEARATLVGRSQSLEDEPFPLALSPCGLINKLQGVRVGLAGPLRLFEACEVRDMDRGSGNLFRSPTFRATAVEQTGGLNAVRFDAVYGLEERMERKLEPLLDQLDEPEFRNLGDPRLTIWFSTTVPYPLLLMAEPLWNWDEVPNREGKTLVEVMRLSQFQRGGAPLEGRRDAVPSERLQHELLPRQPWGPDESGIAHPFPLSAAFQYTRENPQNETAANFWRAHPGAYVVSADYREYFVEDEVHRIWVLALASDQQVLTTCPEQVVSPLESTIANVPLPVRSGLTNTSYGYEDPCEQWDGIQPDAFRGAPLFVPPQDRLPEELPSVRSLLARWRGQVGSTFPQDYDANSWGFALYCSSGDCHDTLYATKAGYGRMAYRYAPNATSVLLGEWTIEGRFSYLGTTVVGDSEYVRLMEAHFEQAESVTFPAVDPPALGSERVVTPAALEVERWTFPYGRLAFATGLVGIIAGLVYWVWPGLKHAAHVALFSRIERPLALRHPARAELATLIEAEPGIHLQELVRRTGRSPNAALHHLRKLVHVGLVSEIAGRGYTCYFPKGKVDRRLMEAAPLLKAEGARRLLEAVAARAGSTASQVARAVGLTRQTASYHLDRLGRAGLVTAERQGRELRLTATELGRSALGLGLAS